MSQMALRAEGLSKRYRLGGRRAGGRTLRETLGDAVRAPFRRAGEADARAVWALQGVSFEVEQGEVLGVIGRNGAGKSTLLRILSRITPPTSGRAWLRGRVGSLLEVGTGFHPELTGRENIQLNGAILGLSRRQIGSKFDQIVAFAEVERFLDTPVKHYSSGMYTRLAFAVAAHLEPEVLLIDEVLAVGDAAFQRKCLSRMDEVARGGRTVLFVSHQMDLVRALCGRCLLLHQGRVASCGETAGVVQEYLDTLAARVCTSGFEVAEEEGLPVQLLRGRVTDRAGTTRTSFDLFEPPVLELEHVVRGRVEGVVVNLELKRNGATLLLSFDTDAAPHLLAPRPVGVYRSRVELPVPLLKPGHYSVSANTGIANLQTYQHLEEVLSFDVELRSRASTFLSYAERRPGLVAVHLDWRTERLAALPGEGRGDDGPAA